MLFIPSITTIIFHRVVLALPFIQLFLCIHNRVSAKPLRLFTKNGPSRPKGDKNINFKPLGVLPTIWGCPFKKSLNKFY